MQENKYEKTDLINAIKRSGYLFESEIVKSLMRRDFFIESNQCIQDPISGKSREIDIIAESYLYNSKESKIKLSSSLKFVFEVKNNDYPLVLMTNLAFSPNIALFEEIKMFANLDSNSNLIYSLKSFEEFTEYNDFQIFTQYCTFAKKKSKDKNNQLMAHHPDNLYSAFSKISQYCDDSIEFCEKEYKDEHNRFRLWIPILLIKNDLFEMETILDKDPRLNKVEESKLVFNYYYKGTPYNSIIYIVTQKGLDSFLDKMLKFQSEFRSQIIEELNKND